MSWKPQAGRLSPAQSVRFGQALTNGIGYIGLGPVFIIINLPERWQKANPPTRRRKTVNWVGPATGSKTFISNQDDVTTGKAPR